MLQLVLYRGNCNADGHAVDILFHSSYSVLDILYSTHKNLICVGFIREGGAQSFYITYSCSMYMYIHGSLSHFILA